MKFYGSPKFILTEFLCNEIQNTSDVLKDSKNKDNKSQRCCVRTNERKTERIKPFENSRIDRKSQKLVIIGNTIMTQSPTSLFKFSELEI